MWFLCFFEKRTKNCFFLKKTKNRMEKAGGLFFQKMGIAQP